MHSNGLVLPLAGHPGKSKHFNFCRGISGGTGCHKALRLMFPLMLHAQSKSLHLAPAGTVMTIPLLPSPWHNISLYFTAQLPFVKGGFNSFIADRSFNKAYFIPLKGLPTARN